MTSVLLTQIVSGLCWMLYGSFFEWYWHKYWMHMPRVPKGAFKGHTIVHHGLYKGDEGYFCREGQHPEHILLKPYALPALLISHAPIVLGIEFFLVRNTAIGALTAALLYFGIYEYMHWNMHVPRGHFVERFRWFQFLREHHKLHHKYFQTNFCVLIPLADWVMGTMMTEESMARRRREREQAIANGTAVVEKQERLRARRSARSADGPRRSKVSSTARRFVKVEVRREQERLQKRRETVASGQNRPQ